MFKDQVTEMDLYDGRSYECGRQDENRDKDRIRMGKWMSIGIKIGIRIRVWI